MKEKSKVAIIVAIAGVISGAVSGIASSSIIKIQQFEYWNLQIINANKFWMS